MKNIEKVIMEIGPVVREIMKEAIEVIRAEANTFVAENKAHYDPNEEDIVTSADRAAQKLYVEKLLVAFPGIGFLCEEEGLKIPCTIPGEDLYVTIDPLDGTKAFSRQQSQGVGTMVGVVHGGTVIAGFVGDVNTGEIYGFSPDAPIPTRLRFGQMQPLVPRTEKPLGERYILSNTAPYRFPKAIQRMILTQPEGGLFKDLDVHGGSYGTFCARLWKGEVGAIILDPGFCTPWDETPVLGINLALGIVLLRIDFETGFAEVWKDPQPPREVVKIPQALMMVPRGYLPQVLEWFRREKLIHTL